MRHAAHGASAHGCLLRHSARASSSCSTKAGSGGFPVFAVGDTAPRRLPEFEQIVVHLSEPRSQLINV